MFPVGVLLTMAGTLSIYAGIKGETAWSVLLSVLQGGTGEPGPTLSGSPSPARTPTGQTVQRPTRDPDAYTGPRTRSRSTTPPGAPR